MLILLFLKSPGLKTGLVRTHQTPFPYASAISDPVYETNVTLPAFPRVYLSIS